MLDYNKHVTQEQATTLFWTSAALAGAAALITVALAPAGGVVLPRRSSGIGDGGAGGRAVPRRRGAAARGRDVAAAAYVYGRAGHVENAGTLLDRLVALAQSRYVSASLLAHAGVAFCDASTTLDRLEQAYQQRAADLVWIAVRPAFRPLRSEPRFRALCEGMGLYVPAAGTT